MNQLGSPTDLYPMKRNPEQILTEWLVLNAQLGEKDAFEQLLGICYPKLLRFAARQLGDDEAARDVVQSTLEAVSRDLGRVKDPAAFIGWLYQILHRKAVDHIRQVTRQRRLGKAVQTESEIAGAVYETPAENVDLDSLLAGLGGDGYQVVHLHYLEGLSVREISQTLALAEGTVKSRLFHARQQLRKLLGDNDE